MSDKPIYFLSDAHIGAPFPDAPEWERRCVGFLRYCSDHASELYILGDLFDFWIEYRHAIRPDYFMIVHELKKLVDSGIPVRYFAGNHDFALGPFISERLGITVHNDYQDLVLQGKRVHLSHGDGLLKADIGYRLLKKILRNKFNQTLYKTLLPQSLGIRLGTFCSGSSRKCCEGHLTEKHLAEYRDHARALLDRGSDVVFFAHTHRAELSRWGEKTYCNTGAWMRTYNFATMTGGIVKLWQFNDKNEPQELPGVDRK
ncbi:MAG: UDP-2,3-diacylglucosamine diphosphatase [Chitinispirillaceae bacterium]|jgi:UDP-2,3-diacylglucosamine hydrolase|nr:UDP-2,3-diacylglucosamine diphosphatase [Chitinispirillaceae bacterium]